MYFPAEHVPAIYDAWIIGDGSLGEIIDALFQMRTSAVLKKKMPPYLYDMYNVFTYVPNKNLGACRTVARIYNALAEGLNNRICLPRFLLVIIDKDIVEDINLFEYSASTAIFKVFEWLIRQINIAIKRRRTELIDVKPGAVYGNDPRIIFVSMLRRPMLFDRESRMEKIVALRSKFNAIINELAESYDNNILNIDICEKQDFDFFD